MKMQDRVKLVIKILEDLTRAVTVCGDCGKMWVLYHGLSCDCPVTNKRLVNVAKCQRALLHGLDNYKALEADRLEAIDLGMAAVQGRDLAMAMASEELDRRMALARAELAAKDAQIEALTQQVAALIQNRGTN